MLLEIATSREAGLAMTLQIGMPFRLVGNDSLFLSQQRLDMPKKIIPFMSYKDADAAITFLKNAFGFEEAAVYRNDDGSIAHAELKLESEYIMLNSFRESKLQLHPPESQDAKVNMGISV